MPMTRPPEPDSFEDPVPPRGDADFVVRLAAYEGPIDLLLEQAREQKVDLTQISILALADQYLDFVEQARRLRLELAADYLVMAAWLAYLKSRLLLPDPPQDDEPTGEELAAALSFQLRRLEAMRTAGERLMARPQLGREMFARGAPEPLPVVPSGVTHAVSFYELLTAYAEHKRRTAVAAGGLQIQASRLYSMDDALKRLTVMLGGLRGWTMLASVLPAGLADPLIARSALAATFAASLELARAGRVELRQDAAFAPLYLRRQQRGDEGDEEEAE